MARSKGTWKYKRRALKDPGRQWGHDQHVALAKACHTVITSNVSQLSALPLFDPFRKSKNMSKKIHKVADDLLKYWESDKATVPTVSAGPADAKMWSSSHSQALAKECRELILQNRRMLNKLPDFENWYPGGNMPRKVGVIADSLLHLYETGSRDDAPKPSAPKGSTTKGKPTSSKANITLTKAREITTPKATRSKLKLELVEGFLEESNDLVTEGKHDTPARDEDVRDGTAHQAPQSAPAPDQAAEVAADEQAVEVAADEQAAEVVAEEDVNATTAGRPQRARHARGICL